MLSIHTNSASLSAQVSLARTEGRMTLAMTRLGTGLRVNSAKDDAAGLQIATRLSAERHGMAAALANIQKSMSMLQTAEGALDVGSAILIRMKDLATQAADGSASDEDRVALQAEYTSLTHELSHLSSATTFGGAKLLLGDSTDERANVAAAAANAAAAAGNAGAALGAAQGNHANALAASQATPTVATLGALAAATGALAQANAAFGVATTAALDAADYANAVAAATAVDGVFSKPLDFQIGGAPEQVMTVRLTGQLTAMHGALHGAASTYDTFGIERRGTGTDLVIASAASTTIAMLDDAIDVVARVRSSLGAAANRLDHVASNLEQSQVNNSAATGRIMDADYAQESASMLAQQMLMQSGTVVLRRANRISSLLMQLLR
ncbi:flagellin [Pseudoduganella sp. LjRoot289]|uniref:flagellin N-terminal helical domain-containing protein n=1 Tax=Pseudoduganella sp. LjRoot289 TaxID=3342314 RepID=UPI003ECD5345